MSGISLYYSTSSLPTVPYLTVQYLISKRVDQGSTLFAYINPSINPCVLCVLSMTEDVMFFEQN